MRHPLSVNKMFPRMVFMWETTFLPETKIKCSGGYINIFILLPEILAWYDFVQCWDSRYSHGVTAWTVRGTHPSWDKRCFSSPQLPARLWGSHFLLFNGAHGSLIGLKRLRRDSVSKLRMSGATPYSLYMPSLYGQGQFFFVSASEKCTTEIPK